MGKVTSAMDTIEYHCPLHGLVVNQSLAGYTGTDDLQTCPFKHHPFDDECGRRLFTEFVQNSERGLLSNL
jgi:hypothetical protein